MKKNIFNKFAFIAISMGVIQMSYASKTIIATVNGMVCAFCAQGIEKKFKKEAAVESIEVKLENKTVSLGIKNGQDLPDDKIKSILTDSGYSVESIQRK